MDINKFSEAEKIKSEIDRIKISIRSFRNHELIFATKEYKNPVYIPTDLMKKINDNTIKKLLEIEEELTKQFESL